MCHNISDIMPNIGGVSEAEGRAGCEWQGSIPRAEV